MKQAGKTSTNVRIDEVTWVKLKIIADREARSTNAQFEMFLKAAVAAYEGQHGPIVLPPAE